MRRHPSRTIRPDAAPDTVASEGDSVAPPPTDADETPAADADEPSPADADETPATDADETPPADADETPAAEDGSHARIIVPGRYVPDDVERGLRDQDGRELPGPGPVPEEMIRDWEAKIARLEGDPAAGDETTTSRSRRRGADGGNGSTKR